MRHLTPIVASLLLLGAYPLSAEDISVEDVVKPDIRAIGQTQGAGGCLMPSVQVLLFLFMQRLMPSPMLI